MGVSNPYLLVCELGPESTLSFDTLVVLNNFTSLHHESRNYSLENPVLVMNVHPKFTRAKKSKILARLRQILLKQLHYDPLNLISSLSFGTYLDIHVDLNMLQCKSWHLAVDLGLVLRVVTVL